MTPRSHLVLISLLVSVLGCAAALVFTRFEVYESFDGPAYMDLAHSLVSGKGLVINNIDADEEEAYKPLTLWPPGYPVLLSSFMALGMSPRTAALLSGTLSYAVVLFLTTLFASHAYGLFGAITAGTILAAQPELWVAATSVWSEPTFIAILLVLAAYMTRGGPRIVVVIVVSALTAGAIYIRNAGYFLGIFFSMLFLMSNIRRERLVVLSCGILSLLLMVPLWVRNFFLTETLHGNITEASAQEGFFDNAWMAGLGILDLFLPDRLDDFMGPAVKIMMGTTVTAAVLFVSIRHAIVKDLKLSDFERNLAIMALSYIAFLLVVRNFKYFDTLDAARFFWPLLPFLALLGARYAAALFHAPHLVLRALPVLLLVGYGALGVAFLYIGPNRAGYPASDSAVQWIEENLPPDACFVSEDGKGHALTLRVDLPERRIVQVTPGFFSGTVEFERLAGEVAHRTGCHYFLSLPRYVGRYDGTTSLDRSSFLDVAGYRALLHESYEGPAQALLNDERGVIVFFPGW